MLQVNPYANARGTFGYLAPPPCDVRVTLEGLSGVTPPSPSRGPLTPPIHQPTEHTTVTLHSPIDGSLWTVPLPTRAVMIGCTCNWGPLDQPILWFENGTALVWDGEGWREMPQKEAERWAVVQAPNGSWT